MDRFSHSHLNLYYTHTLMCRRTSYWIRTVHQSIRKSRYIPLEWRYSLVYSLVILLRIVLPIFEWNLQDVSTEHPTRLLSLNTATMIRDDCIRNLGAKSGKVRSNALCTYNQLKVCSGDGGSPLTTQSTPRTLIGVAT